MKITKSQLKQIIKEELKIAIKENDDWYDDEKGYETVADRKFADQQAQRPYRTGVPDEDLKNADDFEKYPKTSAEAEGERIADELNQEWLAQPGNTEKPLNLVDDDIFTIALAVREGVLDMEDAKQAVRGDLQTLYAAADEANKHLTNKLDDLIGLPEGKAGKYGKGKGVPKGATSAEKEEQKRRERHKTKQKLKKDELDEVKGSGLSQIDNTIFEVIYVIDSILERYEDNISTEDHKRMNDAANKLNRLATDLAKKAVEPRRFESIIQEVIDEVVDEELNEKCKGSGCATPKEVEKYAKAIKRDADNKNEVNPYAVAWKAAREPGSEGGTTVVGRKKGYKK